jgi:hypothetical protein
VMEDSGPGFLALLYSFCSASHATVGGLNKTSKRIRVSKGFLNAVGRLQKGAPHQQVPQTRMA